MYMYLHTSYVRSTCLDGIKDRKGIHELVHHHVCIQLCLNMHVLHVVLGCTPD